MRHSRSRRGVSRAHSDGDAHIDHGCTQGQNGVRVPGSALWRYYQWSTVVLGLAIGLSACPPPLPPDPPEPSTWDPSATCASVCEKWRDLGCIVGEPTPAGVECAEVCETSTAGWDLPCLDAVISCDQIDSCVDQ